MTITNVKAVWVNPEARNVVGEFEITIDGVLLVHKICVIRGKKGLFVAFPNAGAYYDDDGRKKYLDIVHPVDSATREYIIDAVLDAYYLEV